jgi:hypothetical protein
MHDEVTLYTHRGCELCRDLKASLEKSGYLVREVTADTPLDHHRWPGAAGVRRPDRPSRRAMSAA